MYCMTFFGIIVIYVNYFSHVSNLQLNITDNLQNEIKKGQPTFRNRVLSFKRIIKTSRFFFSKKARTRKKHKTY